MAVKDSVTEQQIKEAAKKLFFKEGRFKATTQEIADAAGVNRTLVNYYFRSRDVLFDEVLKDAKAAMTNRLKSSAGEENIPFRMRIERFVDVMIENSFAYPYIDVYLVSRMNDDVNHQNDVLADIKKNEELKHFLKLIEDEMGKGTIEKMPPVQFLLNLLSLLTYPVIVQPLFKKVLHFSDRQYQQMLKDRKEIILKVLLK
ncbi:MAG: TetR/AcrR family transcriptional regulator [Agriterribacter sp.]